MERSVAGSNSTRLLQALAHGQSRDIDELVRALGLSRRQVSDAAAILVRRDLVERLIPGCYRLTDTGRAAAAGNARITSGPTGPTGAIPRRRDTFRERAWRSMRVRRAFTVDDIVSDAGRGEADIRNNAQSYLRQLRLAGYVGERPNRQPGTAPSSPGFKRFMLVRDTGPQAPAYRSALNALHDFNTGEDVPCAPK